VQQLRLSKKNLIITGVMLLLVGILVAFNLVDLKKFVVLAENANPEWLIVGALFQVLTYVVVSEIWLVVLKAAGTKLSRLTLAKLSLEKQTVNRLVPMAGIGGNLSVVQSMVRSGVSLSLATEAQIIDVVTTYAAFTVLVTMSAYLLWIDQGITGVVSFLLAGFAIVVMAIIFSILWILNKRDWRPPKFLHQKKLLGLINAIAGISRERILSPKIFLKTSLLQVVLFALNIGTLWAVFKSLDIVLPFAIIFISYIFASVAGTIIFLPGGLGSFEAGSVAVMSVLGIELETAIAATLLVRGLIYWLPLAPGVIVVHQSWAKSLNQQPVNQG